MKENQPNFLKAKRKRRTRNKRKRKGNVGYRESDLQRRETYC